MKKEHTNNLLTNKLVTRVVNYKLQMVNHFYITKLTPRKSLKFNSNASTRSITTSYGLYNFRTKNVTYNSGKWSKIEIKKVISYFTPITRYTKS